MHRRRKRYKQQKPQEEKQKKTAAATAGSGTNCTTAARDRDGNAEWRICPGRGWEGKSYCDRYDWFTPLGILHPPLPNWLRRRRSRTIGRLTSHLLMWMFRACAPPATRLPMLVSYLLGACISALIWSRCAGAAGGQLVQHPSFHPARFRRHKLRLFPTK